MRALFVTTTEEAMSVRSAQELFRQLGKVARGADAMPHELVIPPLPSFSASCPALRISCAIAWDT